MRISDWSSDVCSSDLEENNGRYIRADHLSQGNVNGFPTYRLKQANMVSLHNRFRGCIRDTRAEFPAAFSDELIALEVYTTSPGTGLSVATPAVRHYLPAGRPRQGTPHRALTFLQESTSTAAICGARAKRGLMFYLD